MQKRVEAGRNAPCQVLSMGAYSTLLRRPYGAFTSTIEYTRMLQPTVTPGCVTKRWRQGRCYSIRGETTLL